MAGAVVQDVRMRVLDARRPAPSTEGVGALGVVLLGEVGGTRRLAIWIGPEEATWIALALNGFTLRARTHTSSWPPCSRVLARGFVRCG